MDGVLIINKPAGMTSHDVVARVRRIINERSVGHLGTLDPSATGVLPLVLGRFTRLAQFYTEADKRYEGTIQFGLSTDTYDAAGEPQGPEQPVHLSLEQIQQVAAEFTGKIEQVPPPFSAKKIAGVPAYKLARKKQEVELKAKQVEVKEFEVLDWDGRQARFRAWVSSGTYVRSLAHELGKKLGPGAYLASLIRTAVREFRIEEARGLDELETARMHSVSPYLQRPITDRAVKETEELRELELRNPTRSTSAMLPQGLVGVDNREHPIMGVKSEASEKSIVELCLHPRLILPEFPAVVAVGDVNARLRHGMSVNLPEFTKAPLVRVFSPPDRLICIARRIAGTLFHPKIVLL